MWNNMTEELNALMTGELGCDDMNLSVYINYCKNKIKAYMPFVIEVKNKNINEKSITKVKDIMLKEVNVCETFLNWCKIERGIQW